MMDCAEAEVVEEDVDPLTDTDSPSPFAPKGIPIEKIIELRNKGLSINQIGKLLGITKQTVYGRLQGYAEDVEALKPFKDNRADMLAIHQRRLLNSLTIDDIKSASPYQRVGMFGILYDKERLERGETTQNIGVADYTAGLDQLRREREALEAELGLNVSHNGDDEGDNEDV